MFTKYFLCVCIVCYFSLAQETKPLQYNDRNFDTKMNEHEVALVLFYAPWCNHCIQFLPKFADAAKQSEESSRPIAFVMVDCENDGKQTCEKFGVSSFPTLKIFRNGKFLKAYEGPREAPAIAKYMKAQVDGDSRELGSVAELEDFLSTDEVSVVGFFESDSYLKVVFFKVVDKMKHKIRFGHSTSEAVMLQQEVADGIVLFRPPHLHNKFEKSSVLYEGDAETDEIIQFIMDNYHGLVGHRRKDLEEFEKEPLVAVFYAVDYKKNTKRTNYWRNRVLPVAKKYENQFYFVISDKDEFKSELKGHKLYEKNLTKPVVLAQNFRKRLFKMKEPFSTEALDNFVQDILDGKLEPEMKSEPIPEVNNGSVTIAVAKNFDKLVYDNGVDTVVLLTGPDCDECIIVEKPYEELGEKMKNEDIAVIKMDISKNSSPQELELDGIPSIFFLPKDSKDYPILHKGDFYIDDFIQFVAQHATNELKGYYRNGKPRPERTEL
ncbi:protein disulfide-isomerase A3 [Tribolium castaneum]|uniref:protein disulfide-isomerase n=1 Tax=Tribolium castaneum TaxID=7070 RepID=D6WN86_TRICA|nr:PREDICTED: protein disulfide-isomerase A3 [Tribolium castaneum]EFA03047.1 Protein disulfide-isomerase-like Protein [Tribolium castaneum]|eukprot:XP_970692.1 PREDICTED: protein disulfide-isomerase A3 [Tribolium castaneum]